MKEKIFKNFTLKLLSAIIAIVLWTVIVNIYDPSTSYTFSNVTVTLLNTETLTSKNYSYEVVEGSKISVSVSGPKSKITDISASDIVATADLSAVTAYSDYVDIDVSVVKDGKVVEGVEATPKTTAVKLNIENRTNKTIELESQLEGEVTSGYALSNVSFSPTSINVVGASSVVENVAHAVVPIDVSNATHTVTGNAAVSLYDSDYNLIEDDTIELSETNINYTAAIGKTKKIPVIVQTSGTPARGYVLSNVSLNVKEVTVVGDEDDINGIVNITIPPENINIEGFSNDKEYKFNLANYLNGNISIISEGTLVVSVDIEPEDSKTITMDKQAIVIKNQNNNTKVSFGDSRYFDIIIKGATEVINTVSASNIAMSVDLTSFGEGTHEVPVNITLPSGCSLSQEYTVDIVISNVIQETQSASN